MKEKDIILSPRMTRKPWKKGGRLLGNTIGETEIKKRNIIKRIRNIYDYKG
jgi:hypothetical protein